MLCLVCRVERCLCALPLEHVIETMRLLPVQQFASAPQFVLGVSIIRGLPVPIVDSCLLLRGVASMPTRCVTLKVNDRVIGLTVDAVVGVFPITPASFLELPPLLGDVGQTEVSALGILDREFLLVLQTGRAIPDSIWAALEKNEGPS